MQIFNRSKPRDVLFLMPVQLRGEKLAANKVRMLYCDAEGKVYTSQISRNVYDTARANTVEMQNRHRPYATVGLETTPGDFLPTVVEINERELWALEHISQHALKTGKLPDLLKKHLKSIINQGVARREAVVSEFKNNRLRNRMRKIPNVLNRLPYYRERDMEISVPIYKADYSYPLIILKYLSNKNGSTSHSNLLVLDSDGDLATIKVPFKVAKDIEKKLSANNTGTNGSICAVVYQQPRGKTVSYLAINQAQKKALETITRYFEETGNNRRTIPAAVRALITLAGKRTIPEVR
jgi:hypothetical protein